MDTEETMEKVEKEETQNASQLNEGNNTSPNIGNCLMISFQNLSLPSPEVVGAYPATSNWG